MVSKISVGRVNTQIVWEIDNFYVYRDCTPEQYLSSSKFLIDGIRQCYLNLHLRYDWYNDSTEWHLEWHLKIQLYCENVFQTAQSKNYTFMILDKKGNIFCQKRGSFDSKDQVSSTFLQRNLFDRKEIFPDGKLTIAVKIESSKKDEEEEEKEEKDDEEEEEEEEEEDKKERDENVPSRVSWLDDYEALIDEEKFSDASLVAEGKTVHVHKSIIAKRSSVLSSMLEKETSLEIVQLTHEVMLEMLRFIYAGKIKDVEKHVGALAVAADKYSVLGLMDVCEKTMLKSVNLENVLERLQLAYRFGMEKLKIETIRYVVQNAKYISGKPEFELLPHNIVCEVFRSLAKIQGN